MREDTFLSSTFYFQWPDWSNSRFYIVDTSPLHMESLILMWCKKYLLTLTRCCDVTASHPSQGQWAAIYTSHPTHIKPVQCSTVQYSTGLAVVAKNLLIFEFSPVLSCEKTYSILFKSKSWEVPTKHFHKTLAFTISPIFYLKKKLWNLEPNPSPPMGTIMMDIGKYENSGLWKQSQSVLSSFILDQGETKFLFANILQ